MVTKRCGNSPDKTAHGFCIRCCVTLGERGFFHNPSSGLLSRSRKSHEAMPFLVVLPNPMAFPTPKNEDILVCHAFVLQCASPPESFGKIQQVLQAVGIMVGYRFNLAEIPIF